MVRRQGPSRWLRLLTLLLTLTLVAAACSDDDGDSDDGNASGSETPSDAASDADPDGTITVAYDLIATVRGGFTWDIAKQPVPFTDDGLFYLVYGALLRPTADGELEPDLAASATVVDDTTIEIKLRSDVQFSDGTPFDAEAVKAGLERSLESNNIAGFGEAFFEVEAVEAVDATTVRLSIPKGTAASWFDTHMGAWQTAIVKADQTDFAKPIGAGPMVVAEFTPQQSATLERSPSYWDVDSIKYKTLKLLGVDSNDARAGVNALAAGQVQMATTSVAMIPNIGTGNELLVVNNPNRLMNFQVCKKDGPLADPKVRLAINKAIDREAINEAVFDGTYGIAHGLWPDGHRFHDPDVEDAISYDPEGAKELLAEAGHADGVELDAYALQSAGMPDVAQVAQQQLDAVGITMNIIPANNYLDQFLVPQKAGVGLVPAVGPNRQKLDQWAGDSIGNTCKYNDPELDELRDQLARVSDSSDEAVELWHQIERKVVAEEALSVFVLFASNITAYNPDAIGDAAVVPTLTQLYVPDPRSSYVKKQ